MFLTTLYNFSGNTNGSPNGSNPTGRLLMDSNGNLFGETFDGGSAGEGTAFELAKDGTGYVGTPTTLITFDTTAGTDEFPVGGLVSDSAGNLYGQVDNKVFELARTGGQYAPALSFVATVDVNISGGLIMDAAGNLFGVTRGFSGSYGKVFEIAKTASGYASTSTTVVAFNGTNGQLPTSNLIMDAQGDLFGTTELGGANGYGTVFEIAKTATGYASAPTVLYNFDKTNGSNPFGGLVMDAAGNLFGTTSSGGAFGKGTVFEFQKTATGYSSTPTIIVSFNGTNGNNPNTTLLIDSAGNLYGTTQSGGATNNGTVFEIVNGAGGYANAPSTLFDFSGSNGSAPRSDLIMDASGNIYGTTYSGGSQGGGTIFELSTVAPLAVTIGGTAQQGQTLTANLTGATGYQWQELVGGIWTDLYGQTGATYVVQASDDGRQIRVEASSSDGRLGISGATNAVLDSAGNQLVYENAFQTTIGSGLLQSVYGNAANATIASGGQQSVYAGGRADQAILNAGGTQLGWGELVRTTLNGGTQYVFGTAEFSVLNSGLQLVENGGIASSTTIHGGEQDVYSGGSATGTKMDGGTQVVYGTADGTSLNVISTRNVTIQSVHGTATNTQLNVNSQQDVYADGNAVGTVINGGAQIVWGTASGTADSSNQYVYGTVTDTTISGFGRQDIQAGGHASNDTLAGYTYTFPPITTVWVHTGGTLDGVALTSKNDLLVLDQSSSLTGTISAWATGNNSIELSDIQFASGTTTLAYAQNSNNTGGTLTVTDGTNVATLNLLGQYSAANFSLSADVGHGNGTLITEVAAPAQPQLAPALHG